MRISDWSSDVCSSDLIQLKRLAERLERQEMRLEVSDTALAELARAGFDPVFGARPLKRAIQQQIENPVARLILEGKFGPRDVVPSSEERRVGNECVGPVRARWWRSR